MSLPVNSNANQISYSTSVDSQLSQVWLYNPSYALYQDPEAPEKQLRDPVLAGALDVLQRSIVGHDYSFEPREDAESPDGKRHRSLAKIIESLTKEQRGFAQSLYNLSRASHRGATWGRILPEKRVLAIGDGKPREWTVVAKVRDVDNRRFRLTQNWGARTSDLLRPGITSGELARRLEATPGLNSPIPSRTKDYETENLGTWRWEFDRGYFAGGGRGGQTWFQPLEESAPNDHWILHVVDSTEWGMGYGWGLQDEIQAYFWLKGTFLRWAAQAAQRFGQGFLLVKTKALRDGMAKGLSQAASLQQTVNVVRTWRSENFAAVDELSDVQLLDLPGEGMRWLYEWVKYFDNAMRQRILAALQPTGSGDGSGGYSSAKVEEGSTEALIAFLRSPLEETWTHTVVRFLIEHNEQNLRELGLWGLGSPRLRLRGKETRDVKEMIEVFKLARELNVPVKLEDFYNVFNLTAPNDEDAAIKYPAAPISGGFELDDGSPVDGGRDPIGEGGGAVADTSFGPRIGRNGAAA